MHTVIITVLKKIKDTRYDGKTENMERASVME